MCSPKYEPKVGDSLKTSNSETEYKVLFVGNDTLFVSFVDGKSKTYESIIQKSHLGSFEKVKTEEEKVVIAYEQLRNKCSMWSYAKLEAQGKALYAAGFRFIGEQE